MSFSTVLDTAVLRGTTDYVLCVVSHCYCYCSSRRGVLLTEIILCSYLMLCVVCFTTIENMVLQILSLVSSFVVVLVYCTVVLLLLAEY